MAGRRVIQRCFHCCRKVALTRTGRNGIHESSLCESSSTFASPLLSRSLIRVRGSDTQSFLQGIVTADVTHSATAQYSMMLNPQGRVLYDVLLYWEGEDSVLMECDNKVASDVVKHLRRYALRSKLDISPPLDDHQLWALFPNTEPPATQQGTSCVADPRVSDLGFRLLIPNESKFSIWDTVQKCSEDDYHQHRVKMGIAEGVEEIPPGSCFPLEYNLDYLNGVSFSKGCYLGQELTARTYHTGVVRKRLMPFSSNSECPAGETVVNNAGKRAGKIVKFCSSSGRGLALIRLEFVVKEQQLSVQSANGNAVLTVSTPTWWPKSN